MRSYSRLASITLAVAAVSWLRAPAAGADTSKLEIGGLVGLHVFADDNELGVFDSRESEPAADSLRNSFALGLRLAYAVMPLVSVEGEAMFMPTESRDSGSGTLAFAYRVHGLIHMAPPDRMMRPFAVLGFGAMSAIESDDGLVQNDSDLLLHTGLGLKFMLGEQWGVRVDGRMLFPPSSKDDGMTVDYEALVGAYFTFGKAETIVAPAPTPAPVLNPAPVERLDSDGDGLYDEDDNCASDAEDKDGFEDDDGCPDPDNDGDGVLDATDKCLNEAETKNGIDDEDGCPERDEDGDGLVGSKDGCPTEAEDKDGFQDEDGCPDLDNDGDGVADADDKCGAEPETANGYQDSDGCPDEIPAKIAKFTGTIKGVTFKSGTDRFVPGSRNVLNRAVKFLNEYGELRLEIQGHTDDKGDDAKNLALSQSRAEAVKQYLVSKGIDQGRLEAKGYGETVPVADNKTIEGRAQNRRVEFALIK